MLEALHGSGSVYKRVPLMKKRHPCGSFMKGTARVRDRIRKREGV